MPLPVVALVALPSSSPPDTAALAQVLLDAGWPVLGARTMDDGVTMLPWLSDDGPRQLRLTHHPGVPSGRVGPRGPDPASVEAALSHLRVALLVGPEDRLEADLLLVRLLAALLPACAALAVRLEHLQAWLHPDEWRELVERDAGFGVPAELMVDLEIGPLGPEAVGVLSDGLERYGLREVLAVADRSRLADGWALASSVIEDRLLGAEPDVDLSPGPHPRRPQERVDVAFVDEDPDEDEIEVEVVHETPPDEPS